MFPRRRDGPGGSTDDDRTIRHVTSDYRAGTDRAPCSDSTAREHDRADADEGQLADRHFSADVNAWRDVREVADVRVVIDGAAGVENHTLSDVRRRDENRSGRNHRPLADFRVVGHRRMRVQDRHELAAGETALPHHACPRRVVAYRNDEPIRNHRADVGKSPQNRHVGNTGPFQARTIVEKASQRGSVTSQADAGADDVRDDLAVAPGAENHDLHRPTVPINSSAVACPG